MSLSVFFINYIYVCANLTFFNNNSNNITYLEVLDFGSHGLEEVAHHEISSSTNRSFDKTKY